MSNKENPNYTTGTTKEEERKQFAKPGSKSESQNKPGNKPQQGKAPFGNKAGSKECSMSEEADDEECGSSSRSKSCG